MQNPPNGLVRAKVTVIRKLSGDIVVKYKGKPLPVIEYFKQPYNGDIVHSKEIDRFLKAKKTRVVSVRHPWSQEGRAEANRKAFQAA